MEALTAVTGRSRNDPLKAETIVVQSKGMERWISLELARRQGICANVAFPFPTVS
jgi:exodeoxyribonuclease V gamma subunit